MRILLAALFTFSLISVSLNYHLTEYVDALKVGHSIDQEMIHRLSKKADHYERNNSEITVSAETAQK